MPVYDYRCTDCGSLYDILHLGKENSRDIVCPSCGSSHHKKLMSLPAVPAKGPNALPCSDGACRPGGSCCEGGRCGLL